MTLLMNHRVVLRLSNQALWLNDKALWLNDKALCRRDLFRLLPHSPAAALRL
jgi:hypothetical protein